MQDFQRNPKYELSFASCVFAGISNEIDFEMKYGTEDRTEEFQYLVDRYNNDFIVSGYYLNEKLEEYKQAIKLRQTYSIAT